MKIENNDTKSAIEKYFNRLRITLSMGLIICFALPLLLLSAYFHFQFTDTLKKSSKVNLFAIAQSQKNTIDLFLQERVVNLFGLFHDSELSLNPSEKKIEKCLNELMHGSETFIDIGFIDNSGIQTGYSGPFGYLKGKNYSHEDWYKRLTEQQKNYIITDIYLGFRNKPHFTVAVRQLINGKSCIIRSTLDPDKFYTFLKTIGDDTNVESMLINSKGLYQVVNPAAGKRFSKYRYSDLLESDSGIKEIQGQNGPLLIAYTRLSETAWTLVVREPLDIAYKNIYTAKRIITVTIVALLFGFTLLIYLLVKKLINNSLEGAENTQDLQNQLFHASKLASIGEIATGVAHEINNPLAIILSTSGVIKDLFNPEFKLDSSPKNILSELENIDIAVLRAKEITSQLLRLGRKSTPVMTTSNINKVLLEAVKGIQERELKLDDISLSIETEKDLPDILINCDQMRQVFINLINNAHDAIEGEGKIIITTTQKNKSICIRIEDTGKGMSPEEISQIFNPFYTTKPVGKGTGLGLSVSLNIVESMGGSINIQSIKERGSVFEIDLPFNHNENRR